MTPDFAMKLMSDMLWSALLLCMPVLGATMVVGVVISVLQAITQVQEMSLTFVPKLVIAGLVMLMFGNWMLALLSRFATQLWSNIPNLFS